MHNPSREPVAAGLRPGRPHRYDWQGRRIEKKVWTYSTSWSLSEHWKFMYADWLLLLELDGLASDSAKRQYTWGRDLSGLQRGASATANRAAFPNALTAAGGIGGLLAVHDGSPSASYVYFSDVQGNVGQVIDLGAGSASASIKYKYQYDAYGNRTLATGTYTQPLWRASRQPIAKSAAATGQHVW